MSAELFRALAQSLLSSPAASNTPTLTPQEQAKQMLAHPSIMQQQADLQSANQMPLSNSVMDQVTSKVAETQQPLAPPPMAAAPIADIDPATLTAEPDPNVLLGDDGAPMTPQGLMEEATAKRDADLNANKHLAGMQRRAAVDTAAAARDEQVAGQPAEDELHSRIEQGYNELHDVQVEVDEQAKAAIADYHSTQDEMKKMAVAAPQDIWGQSGVNKYLGAVSIFFGGMGTNGNHANHNLEFINALADRAVAAQKTRFDNLKAVGEGDNTLYGMLQKRLQNAQAVSGTIKNAALESYKSAMRTTANKYADPKYRAMVEQNLATVEQQQNKINQDVGQTYIANKQRALQLIGQEKAQNIAANLLKQKQEQKELEHGIAGYKGYVPIPAEHAKLAQIVSGGRQMIIGANHLENALNGNMSVGKYRQLLSAYALQFSGARKYLDTGTRIEEGEQKIIDALNVLPSEAAIGSLTPDQINGLRDKLNAIRYLIREGMDTSVTTYAPGLVTPDLDDPITGPWSPEHNPLIGDRQTAEMNASGTNPRGTGADMLSSLPNADGSKTDQDILKRKASFNSQTGAAG